MASFAYKFNAYYLTEKEKWTGEALGGAIFPSISMEPLVVAIQNFTGRKMNI